MQVLSYVYLRWATLLGEIQKRVQPITIKVNQDLRHQERLEGVLLQGNLQQIHILHGKMCVIMA